MFSPTNKANKNSPVTQTKETGTSFFRKSGEDTFFGENKIPAFFGPHIQAKLSVSDPGDPEEKEADAVADKVVQRMSEQAAPTNPQVAPAINKVSPHIQKKCSACDKELQQQEHEGEFDQEPKHKGAVLEINDSHAGNNSIQKKCAACEHEEKLHKKSGVGEQTNPSRNFEDSLSNTRGSGSKLPDPVRHQMESSIGADFSNVKIHNGSAAIQMSQQLNAQAFTHGSDIYFNENKYNPGHSDGKHLLAHELTHTIQQGSVKRKPKNYKESVNAGEETGIKKPQGVDNLSDKQVGQEAAHPDETSKGEVRREEARVNTKLPSTVNNNKGNPLAKEAARLGQQKSAGNKEQISKKISPAATRATAEKKNKSLLEKEKSAWDGAKEGLDKKEVNPLKATILTKKNKLTAALMQSQGVKTQLQAVSGRVTGLVGAKVSFKLPDSVGKEKNEAPDPALLNQQLQSNNLVNGFMAEMPGRISPLKNLAGVIQSRIQGALASNSAKITAEISAKKAAITARINQARGAAQAHAAGAKKQVEAKHSTTMAAIQASAITSQVMLDTEYQAALAAIAVKETSQVQTIDRLYGEADRKYRDAGVTVGNEATGIGNGMASEYRSHKIHERDSLLDGYLTDRRCEARATAAEQVSGSYRTGLADEANKQADEAQKGKQRDQETTRTTIQQSHEALTNQYTAAKQGIESVTQQAIQQAGDTKTGLIHSIDSQLQATIGSLRTQQATHVQTLEDMGQAQKGQLEENSQLAITGLLTGLNQTITELVNQVQRVQSMLNGKAMPEMHELSSKIGNARIQIMKGVETVSQGFDTSLFTTEGTLSKNSESSIQTVGTASKGIIDTINAGDASFTRSMSGITRSATTAFTQIQQGHDTNSTQTAMNGRDGMVQIMATVDATFVQLNTALQASFDQAVPGLLQGLRGCFEGAEGMRTLIRQKAQEAAEAEKPAWQSIVKWILIIAVVIVVALVVGPAVIGAVGAYLGAGTLATTIVAGAIVGAATSATIQVINNVADGHTWYQGVGTAALIGAVGGAAGGALGFGLNSLATQVGGRVFAQHIATQLVLEQVGNAVVDLSTQLITTGHISWADFGVGALMSLGTFGLARTQRGHAISQDFQARGASAGDGLRVRMGGTPRPATPVTAPAAASSTRTPAETVSTPHAEPVAAPHAEAVAAPHAEPAPAPHAEPAPVSHAEPAPVQHTEPATAPHSEPASSAPAESAPATQSEPTTAPHPEPAAPHSDAQPAAAPHAEERATTASHAAEPAAPHPEREGTVHAGEPERTSAPAEREGGATTGDREHAGSRPETETPRRSSHEGDPHIEEGGIVAKEPTRDGHEVKVLEDGRIVICSECAEIRAHLGDELTHNPAFEEQLRRIEGIADPVAKAAEAVRLRDQLRDFNARRPTMELDPQHPDGPPNAKSVNEANAAFQAEAEGLFRRARRPDLSRGEPNLDFVIEGRGQNSSYKYADVKTPVDASLRSPQQQVEDISHSIRKYDNNVMVVVDLRNFSVADRTTFIDLITTPNNGINLRNVRFINAGM